MVGDSVDADIEGANAVGLETALFNNDATGLDSRERPDHRIDDFREITEVVL
jgi:FMN phosphatase YigB (HAD superfamily)